MSELEKMADWLQSYVDRAWPPGEAMDSSALPARANFLTIVSELREPYRAILATRSSPEWQPIKDGGEEMVPKRLLDGRDDFIVRKGLWSEFVDGLDDPRTYEQKRST